ncbi:hypothetical protein D3C78_1576760 [compost metagenome]
MANCPALLLANHIHGDEVTLYRNLGLRPTGSCVSRRQNQTSWPYDDQAIAAPCTANKRLFQRTFLFKGGVIQRILEVGH